MGMWNSSTASQRFADGLLWALKIIQEIMRSSSVIMVCGEDLFHLWELEAAFKDILMARGPNRKGAYRTRENRMIIGRLGVMSFYLEAITGHTRAPVKMSIWELVCTFSSHYCSDPRDRVFGLLALADSKSRDVLRPDYTKSSAAVLLQLIEYQAENDKGRARITVYKVDFAWTRKVIGAFGFHSNNFDVAGVRDRRRTAVHGEEPFSAIVTSRNQQPLKKDACFPRRLSPVLDPGSNHIALEAEAHCTVWKNDEGQLIAPLWRSNKESSPIRNAFSAVEEDAADGIRLHTPDGSVIGLANKRIQPKDTILLFDDGNDRMLSFGLIVRRFRERDGSFIATIVGQCFFNTDVSTCRGGYRCLCEGASHVSDKEAWKVYMSPEDLLAFVAQDLKLVHRPPSELEVPMVDLSVDLEKNRDRVTTRVTSEEFSSYAIVTPSQAPQQSSSLMKLAYYDSKLAY
jgi:hypothetical protein